MHISIEGKLGLLVGLIGLGGAGAVVIAPEVGWGLIGVAVIGGIVLAFHHFSEALARIWNPGNNTRMIALAGMIVRGTGFIAFAGVYFWPARGILPGSQQEHHYSPLNQTILLACAPSALPDTVPQNGQYELKIIAGDVGGVFDVSMQQPGSKANWSADTSPTFALVCRFTNFGSSPIVNVEAYLELNIRNVVEVGTETRSGEIIRTHTITTARANLGIGDRNSFEFYVRNYSKYWAEIVLPTYVALTPVGSDHPTIVGLIQPPIRGFELQPFSRNPNGTKLSTQAPTIAQAPTLQTAPDLSSARNPVLIEPPQSARKNPDGSQRIFIRVLPHEMWAIFEGRTANQAMALVAPYLHKWISISAIVNNAKTYTDGTTIIHFVSVTNQITVTVTAAEFEEKWRENLNAINKGDTIKAVCRISKIEQSIVNMDSCELIE